MIKGQPLRRRRGVLNVDSLRTGKSAFGIGKSTVNELGEFFGYPGKSPFSIGKSTISTGPCSMSGGAWGPQICTKKGLMKP